MITRFTSRLLLILNLILAYTVGVVTIIGFFTRGTFADLGSTLAQWAVVLAAFALLVGLGNLVRVHVGRVAKRGEGWPYSIILVVSALTVLGFGLISGKGAGDPYVAWMFKWLYQPLGAAVFSLLAFFLTTAFFRAPRIRSVEAIVLLVVALVVVIGTAPFSTAPELSLGVQAKDWLMDYPVLAGVRAIVLGVAFGTLGVSLRVLSGFDRPYME
jgi:hypothetical protein